MTSIIRRYFE